MQDCTSLQTDNHASTPPLSFLQAGCPSCRPTNSVKALKAPLLIAVKNKFIVSLTISSGAFSFRVDEHAAGTRQVGGAVITR